MITIGLALSLLLIRAPIDIGGIVLDVHSLLYTSTCAVIGFQFVFFFIFAKVFAWVTGLLPASERLKGFFHYITLEKGLLVGMLFILAGAALTVKSVVMWHEAGFGELVPQVILRSVIPAVTTLTLGIQIVLYSFFLSILGIHRIGNESA
jgi:hypothetical protein